ncbi:sulfotransferase family 2 domain-containing protein [Campylobacter sp. RM13119]|uniref:sulfotransferase family 2 domain-containing protein n=1 Tax=Campylobacter californiensis TaxID=1032243 RepID=UPI0014758F4B|nr:sulfotransferase family 2 domain-containing protein [Campylobacter sp. RM13119]MBE3606333.1 sulfotransferase family 2 domain-containing protein [Campylobacter sp. RM13119]
MIASVHIHKNGGMQFKNFLLKYFGKELCLEYGKDNAVLERFFSGGKNPEPKVDDYKAYKIVYGHFLANRFDSFDNIELITFLRDPAQRLVSNYYFFKRNFYNHSPICHMIKNGLTLEQYIDLEGSKNVQSFFLANKSIDDFKFIGILEDYEASIKIMKKIFDLKLNIEGQLFYYQEYMKYIFKKNKPKVMTFDKFSANKNKDKNEKKYEISLELLEKIKQNNLLDYELYENAKIKFNKIKEKYDV